MKATNAQITAALERIDIVNPRTIDKALGLKLMDIGAALESEAAAFERKRQFLIQRHAAEDQEGAKEGTVQLDDPEAFQEELKELLAGEVEVDVPLISWGDLPSQSGLLRLLGPLRMFIE